MKYAVVQESRLKRMDINEQEASVQKFGGQCKLMRGEFHIETQAQYIVRYPCEVNPRAKRSSQSVKRVKRETLLPPQIPLSISWLGEAKTAWKARRIAKARPSQAVATAQVQKRLKGGSSIRPGARAASKDAIKQAQ